MNTMSKEQYLELKAGIESLNEKYGQLVGLVEKRVVADKRKSVSLSEAAVLLGKTYQTIRRYVYSGRLEIVENSNPVKVTMRSVNNFQ